MSIVSNIFSACLSAQTSWIRGPEAYLESMHKKAEEGHEVGQLGGFELRHDSRDELWDKLGHGRTDSIDELGE
jgi:hypothetical protein